MDRAETVRKTGIRCFAVLAASLTGIGCAADSGTAPPVLSATSQAASQDERVPGLVVPACGYRIEQAHLCAENESADRIYVESQDSRLASWVEYLRECRAWEAETGEHLPLATYLELIIFYRRGSRPDIDRFQSRLVLFVEKEYHQGLSTDGLTTRAYFTTYDQLINDREREEPCPSLDCIFAKDTVSILQAAVSVLDPQSGRIEVFPVRDVDPTWVEVRYLQPRAQSGNP